MLPCHDAFSLFESGDPSFCAVVGKGALGLLVHHYTTYIMYAMCGLLDLGLMDLWYMCSCVAQSALLY